MYVRVVNGHDAEEKSIPRFREKLAEREEAILYCKVLFH
jgi:hypothetical protein